MANYVLVYRGGATAADDDEMAAAMARWEAWFASLGETVVDWGSPFGRSTTVSGATTIDGGVSALTGYSIITAENLSAASEAAQACPVLVVGGSVEVYEATPIG